MEAPAVAPVGQDATVNNPLIAELRGQLQQERAELATLRQRLDEARQDAAADRRDLSSVVTTLKEQLQSEQREVAALRRAAADASAAARHDQERALQHQHSQSHEQLAAARAAAADAAADLQHKLAKLEDARAVSERERERLKVQLEMERDLAHALTSEVQRERAAREDADRAAADAADAQVHLPRLDATRRTYLLPHIQAHQPPACAVLLRCVFGPPGNAGNAPSSPHIQARQSVVHRRTNWRPRGRNWRPSTAARAARW